MPELSPLNIWIGNRKDLIPVLLNVLYEMGYKWRDGGRPNVEEDQSNYVRTTSNGYIRRGNFRTTFIDRREGDIVIDLEKEFPNMYE